MLWSALITLAVALVFWMRRQQGEVPTIALGFSGFISFLWGFLWAPAEAQLAIATSASIWLWMRR
ncbi:MAG: hypothetical protein ACTS2F_23710 [Thainema sp.]